MDERDAMFGYSYSLRQRIEKLRKEDPAAYNDLISKSNRSLGGFALGAPNDLLGADLSSLKKAVEEAESQSQLNRILQNVGTKNYAMPTSYHAASMVQRTLPSSSAHYRTSSPLSGNVIETATSASQNAKIQQSGCAVPGGLFISAMLGISFCSAMNLPSGYNLDGSINIGTFVLLGGALAGLILAIVGGLKNKSGRAGNAPVTIGILFLLSSSAAFFSALILSPERISLSIFLGISILIIGVGFIYTGWPKKQLSRIATKQYPNDN